MASHRIQIPLPSDVAAQADMEVFSRRLAAALMLEMGSTWGPIWSANNQVLAWDAHGWQPDGTFVVLSVRPNERSVHLYVDTKGLQRPSPPPASLVNRLLIALLLVAVGVGLWQRSFWLGFATLIGAVGVWIGKDIFLQIRAENRRTIDTAGWDSRLTAAVVQQRLERGF
jgi:hypothetical protein